MIGIFYDIASRFGLSFYLSDTDCIGTRISLNDAATEYDSSPDKQLSRNDDIGRRCVRLQNLVSQPGP